MLIACCKLLFSYAEASYITIKSQQWKGLMGGRVIIQKDLKDGLNDIEKW